MDSPLATIGLPAALGIIMFGLGLSLTIDDFKKVARSPKIMAIALGCQLLLLPVVAFGLVKLLGLNPYLAVGMMLLAACPGGTTANLFSHLFRGDVALNVSLTAVNSVVALFTLPLITNFAIVHFGLKGEVSLPFLEVVKVFAIVLVPTAIGMFVKSRAPQFAASMDRPVRALSAIVLAVMVIAILVAEWDNAPKYIASVGLVAVIFCALSLVIGYYVPRGLGLPEGQSIASSFEIGVHNSTLGIYIAVEILDSVAISVPSAVYSLVMFAMAAIWGVILTKAILPRRAAVPAV